MTVGSVTGNTAVRAMYGTPAHMQGQPGSVALMKQALSWFCKLVLLLRKYI